MNTHQSALTAEMFAHWKQQDTQTMKKLDTDPKHAARLTRWPIQRGTHRYPPRTTDPTTHPTNTP